MYHLEVIKKHHIIVTSVLNDYTDQLNHDFHFASPTEIYTNRDMQIFQGLIILQVYRIVYYIYTVYTSYWDYLMETT